MKTSASDISTLSPGARSAIEGTASSPESGSKIEQDKKRRYPGAFSSEEPTPYDKAVMKGLAEDVEQSEDGLHNARNPHYNIQHERAEHRVIIFLKAEGYSNKEIAEKVGMTPVAVSNIIRQPWAQKRLIEEIQKAGRNSVEMLLKGEVVNSIQTLIELRDADNATVPPAVRRTAADSLIDRIMGRPTQPIMHKNDDLSKLSDAELAALVNKGKTN